MWILALLALVLVLLWPFFRTIYHLNKTRKHIRDAMRGYGNSNQQRQNFHNQRQQGYSRRQQYSRPSHGKVIPPDYPEDVEYLIIKEFHSHEETSFTHKNVVYTQEHQVSDAEWVEIKNPDKKDKKI